MSEAFNDGSGTRPAARIRERIESCNRRVEMHVRAAIQALASEPPNAEEAQKCLEEIRALQVIARALDWTLGVLGDVE